MTASNPEPTTPCSFCRPSHAMPYWGVRWYPGCDHAVEGWACSDAQGEFMCDGDFCESIGETYAEFRKGLDGSDRARFLNRLRILRSIDRHEVLGLTDQEWTRLRANPCEFVIRCSNPAAEHVWAAVRKRESR